MNTNKHTPIESFVNLRERVDRFFRVAKKRRTTSSQLTLSLLTESENQIEDTDPNSNVTNFISFLSDATPNGELYLFGGILRDIALFGRRGFSSDIDIVAEGDWQSCEEYIQSKGAQKNKFGGYRLYIGKWPIDIWNARNTWAISKGLVKYSGIASLTETTVLNWDAILMNWRTRNFIARDGYLESIKERKLDVVLKENPNPMGMAVRVFRHICMKEPRQITPRAIEYLAECTTNYSFEDLQQSEIRSYGNTIIEYAYYRWFELLLSAEKLEFSDRVRVATNSLRDEGILLSQRQKMLYLNTDTLRKH